MTGNDINQEDKDFNINLLARLFDQRTTPSFKTEANRSKIKEFVCREDVHSMASEFVNRLMEIWKHNYPGIQLEKNDLTAVVAPLSRDLLEPAEPSNRAEEKHILVADGQTKITNQFRKTSIFPNENRLSQSDKGLDSLPRTQNYNLGGRLVGDSQVEHSAEIAAKNKEIFDNHEAIVSSNPTKHTEDRNRGLVSQIPLVKEQVPLKPNHPGKVPMTTEVDCSHLEPSYNFSIPVNAKIGETYRGSVIGKDSNNKNLKILDVKISENIGLIFDPNTEELHGTPVIPGEHVLSLRWRFPNTNESRSGECLLVVIPDAKSLWKNIEPPKDDHYFKSNSSSKLIKTEKFQIACASARGRSHAHAGIFRDDDFYISHDSESEWSILIVADGAGGSKNSRWGSKLAVEAVGHHLAKRLYGDFGKKMSDALNNWEADTAGVSKEMYNDFYYLFQEASSFAIQSIETEASIKGVSPKEYSTTVLAAAVHRNETGTFLSTFWMGDGAIAAYGPSGKVRLMGVPDSGEYAGQTRFLDRAALVDQGFSKRVQIGFWADITAVLLMTDGISDPRFETDNGLVNPEKWDDLWNEILPFLAGSHPEKNLLGWLDFLTPGHHDDRTIALLW